MNDHFLHFFSVIFVFLSAEKVDLVINRRPPFLFLLPSILCMSIGNCSDSGGDSDPKHLSVYLSRNN